MKKKIFKGFFLATTVLSIGNTYADSCTTSCPTLKCYKRRSDSRHKYIQLAGSANKTYIKDADALYGTLTITPGYRASFRPQKISECLFGDHLSLDTSCCGDRAIRVQGSAIASRDPKAWLADYFYLPRNFNGFFTITPRIKTFFCDLDLYLGFDNCLCGLYGRVYGDIVHSRWALNFCENVTTSSTPLDHPHGYFSPASYEGGNLLDSFTRYARGEVPAQSKNTSNLVGLGATEGIKNEDIKYNALKYAKILQCSQKQSGFADLRFELGWNLHRECYHFGFNVQFAAPTGTNKEPCVLFDAMVGNGEHWEVGGGFTSHYRFWRNERDDAQFSIHLDANITHLFKKRMKRTFDLQGKPNSAYMLAARFGENGTDPDDQIKSAANTPIDKQFAGEYAPVANLSTTSVDVSIGAQADVVIMLDYTQDCFSWNIGYNFWGTSCEKISCPESCSNSTSLCNSSQQDTWALKGDARMFGFTAPTACDNSSEAAAIPLSATQKDATILNGTNQVPAAQVATIDNCSSTDINSKVDTPVLAIARAADLDVFNIPRDCDPADQINTSQNPVFLSCDDLDFTRIRGITHTIFSNLTFTWERECVTPYLGLGAAAEFSHSNSCCPDTSNAGSAKCGPCLDCAVSQWSIWVMGGMLFG